MIGPTPERQWDIRAHHASCAERTAHAQHTDLAMAYCPHCNVRYDETNETQPCCYSCGHPISCGCGGGHSYSPPSPSVPPSVLDDVKEEQSPDDETKSDGEEGEDTYTPEEDNLPF